MDKKSSRRKQQAIFLTSPENIALEKRKREEQKQKINSKRARNLFPELSSESEKEDDEDEEQNNTMCGFCLVKYSDPISSKLGDWIQCQGKAREWYHEKCVGAAGMKKFVCGRCNVKK